ncbi:hypothetical protein ACN4EK_18090 [Pantanalinema rosaneae CENA516]|uniref:hypothetical protein n=1 Tax=Pantanalinema rosaneae TaxID=1620701 RepID=UPI003D6DE9BB
MDNEVMCSDHVKQSAANVERDLWVALLQAESVSYSWQSGEPLTEDAFVVAEDPTAKIAYPWNPLSLEAESFFAEVDEDLLFDGFSAEEISARSTTFFEQMDTLWVNATLQSSLMQQFAVRVPQAILSAIVERVQKVATTAESMADRLIGSVQDLLPNLALEDLEVLARPLAYELRDSYTGDPVKSMLAKVPQANWQDQSELNQARLSLAVAHYAIAALQKSEQSPQ